MQIHTKILRCKTATLSVNTMISGQTMAAVAALATRFHRFKVATQWTADLVHTMVLLLKIIKIGMVNIDFQ